ncbi:MAG: SPFH domain-containing protein [Pseudomonadota bacterium]
MRRIRAKPSEFLVVSRNGLLRNVGLGGRAWLWPGVAAVRVPGSKQETLFAMTQETRDGIPLRFKGEVQFRVVDPVQAAACFDFGDSAGLEQLKNMVCHVCLGELRDLVSHMTLQDCVEGRKSTLAQGVATALSRVAGADPGAGTGWGIAVELVQVAQVFIVDDDLRAQLEAELRDEIAARSERSHIDLEETLAQARNSSQQRLLVQQLEADRAQQQADLERLHLERGLERERILSAAPVRQLELERQSDLMELEIAVRRLANRLRQLEVEGDMLDKRSLQELEREILPLRQVPEVARALGGMFNGAHLSLVGADDAVLTSLAPLVDLLAQRLRPGS